MNISYPILITNLANKVDNTKNFIEYAISAFGYTFKNEVPHSERIQLVFDSIQIAIEEHSIDNHANNLYENIGAIQGNIQKLKDLMVVNEKSTVVKTNEQKSKLPSNGSGKKSPPKLVPAKSSIGTGNVPSSKKTSPPSSNRNSPPKPISTGISVQAKETDANKQTAKGTITHTLSSYKKIKTPVKKASMITSAMLPTVAKQTLVIVPPVKKAPSQAPATEPTHIQVISKKSEVSQSSQASAPLPTNASNHTSSNVASISNAEKNLSNQTPASLSDNANNQTISTAEKRPIINANINPTFKDPKPKETLSSILAQLKFDFESESEYGGIDETALKSVSRYNKLFYNNYEEPKDFLKNQAQRTDSIKLFYEIFNTYLDAELKSMNELEIENFRFRFGLISRKLNQKSENPSFFANLLEQSIRKTIYDYQNELTKKSQK